MVFTVIDLEVVRKVEDKMTDLKVLHCDSTPVVLIEITVGALIGVIGVPGIGEEDRVMLVVEETVVSLSQGVSEVEEVEATWTERRELIDDLGVDLDACVELSSSQDEVETADADGATFEMLVFTLLRAVTEVLAFVNLKIWLGVKR